MLFYYFDISILNWKVFSLPGRTGILFFNFWKNGSQNSDVEKKILKAPNKKKDFELGKTKPQALRKDLK